MLQIKEKGYFIYVLLTISWIFCRNWNAGAWIVAVLTPLLTSVEEVSSYLTGTNFLRSASEITCGKEQITKYMDN